MLAECESGPVKPLQPSAEDRYNHVLRLFDNGIAALKEAEAADIAAKCGAPAPPVSTVSS